MKKTMYSFIILISSNLWCMEKNSRRFTPQSIAARSAIITTIQSNCSPETKGFIQQHIGIHHAEPTAQPASDSWICLELLKLRLIAYAEKNFPVGAELTRLINRYHALANPADSQDK